MHVKPGMANAPVHPLLHLKVSQPLVLSYSAANSTHGVPRDIIYSSEACMLASTPGTPVGMLALQSNQHMHQVARATHCELTQWYAHK